MSFLLSVAFSCVCPLSSRHPGQVNVLSTFQHRFSLGSLNVFHVFFAGGVMGLQVQGSTGHLKAFNGVEGLSEVAVSVQGFLERVKTYLKVIHGAQ